MSSTLSRVVTTSLRAFPTPPAPHHACNDSTADLYKHPTPRTGPSRRFATGDIASGWPSSPYMTEAITSDNRPGHGGHLRGPDAAADNPHLSLDPSVLRPHSLHRSSA